MRTESKDSGTCSRAGRERSPGCSSLGVMPMSEVTRILYAIEQGDPAAAEQLLPLVYDELRKLAAQKVARGHPEQTSQAPAGAPGAFPRLVPSPARESRENAQNWDHRGHFFAAAAT